MARHHAQLPCVTPPAFSLLAKPLYTRQTWGTGVVENVLGQVLEAFQSRMTGLLGRCTCRALADNLQLAANMAKEPSAPQVMPPCTSTPCDFC